MLVDEKIPVLVYSKTLCLWLVVYDKDSVSSVIEPRTTDLLKIVNYHMIVIDIDM